MQSQLTSAMASRPVIGTFNSLPSPAAMELLAWSDLDFVCVDAEHAAMGITEIEQQVRAAGETSVIVRVPELGHAISRVLDTGAAGVLVPRVESAAQTAEAVARARFAPEGVRGAGPGRAARYGTALSGYLDTSPRAFVAVQIETRAGLEAAEEIAAVPGLDLVFVGPMDLGVSLGAEPGSAEHSAAVQRIFAAAASCGLPTGYFCMSGESVDQALDAGVRLVLHGTDAILLGSAVRAVAEDARRRVEARA